MVCDEDAERLLLGQLLWHPERFRELRLGADHFHSGRRTLFRVLHREAQAGRLVDLVSIWPAIAAAGLTNLALACHEEWDELPLPLRDLERRLHDRHVRRRLYLLGTAMIQ